MNAEANTKKKPFHLLNYLMVAECGGISAKEL